ncbi:MAG: hybrid sensor histidine kinase/response regulator [Anaerolineae bacterium]|nr:hybrid sensor histidine kinase/response regulator [Anaerolineae bacterium]
MTEEAKPATILLIDDEESLLFGLTAIIRRAGYEVISANNGTDGIQLARENHPDLILCDVMMPPPDGFEVRRILSIDPETACIPFIFVTARSTQTDKVQGIELGADDYITKPFDRQELVARIKATLRRDNISRQRGKVDAETQMERMRQEVIKNFTHELRTPLSKIMLSLNLILKEKLGERQDDKQQFLRTALGSAKHLENLIDDLLFLSLIDQGELDFFRQPIRLTYQFHEPIEQCLQRWQTKNLLARVIVEPGVEIYAPRNRFQQALIHLIDNACKFSPEQGEIHMHLEPNGIGGCILTITDQGPGIPKDQWEKVFERYYQVSQGDGRVYEGLGIGLTIARAFAQALGGNVKILDSEAGCRVQMVLGPISEEDQPVIT